MTVACHGILGFKSSLSSSRTTCAFISEPCHLRIIFVMLHDSRLKSRPISRSYKPTRKKNSSQNALRAVFSGRHLTFTIPWLIQKTQGPVTPSTALSTKGSFVLFPSAGLSSPILRQVARKVVHTAVSVLCDEMLQPGQCAALGLDEMEEVEVRLRALARFEPIWGKSKFGVSGISTQLGPLATMRERDSNASALGEEMERKLFAAALRDGYILCQWVSFSNLFFRVFWGRSANVILFFPFLLHVV